jgi:hypothetical protein
MANAGTSTRTFWFIAAAHEIGRSRAAAAEGLRQGMAPGEFRICHQSLLEFVFVNVRIHARAELR